MEVVNTKRTNNLSNYTDFNKCLESIFGKDVSDKIHKSEMTSPEDLKEHRIEMSFDDVVTIWNAGVSNGVEGYKYKILNTLKQIVSNVSKCITDIQTVEEVTNESSM